MPDQIIEPTIPLSFDNLNYGGNNNRCQIGEQNSSVSVNGQNYQLGLRYSNIVHLGSGGYGQVLAAYDQLLKKRVAIKKVQLPAKDGDLFLKRTLSELCILIAVKHENILQIMDCFIPPGATWDKMNEIYLVTNLLATDLHKIIKANRQAPVERKMLSAQHVQYLMYQLVRGVKFMHSANILHRDLKPSNIFINNATCDLVIGDFGLAKIVGDDDDKLTEYVCTRWYRGPELMLLRGRYNKAMDMWSVGCIFGELIYGVPLFPGRHYGDQLTKILDRCGFPEDKDLTWIPETAKRYMANIYKRSCKQQPKSTFSNAFPTPIIDKLDPLTFNLLEKLLTFNPNDRITAEEAIKNEYFGMYRDSTDEPQSSEIFQLDLEPFSTDQLKQHLFKKVNHVHAQVQEDYLLNRMET